MAEAPTNNVGAILKIVPATPDTDDEAGYIALEALGNMEEIGDLITIPASGNMSNGQRSTHLKDGVEQAYNGALKVDDLSLPYTYRETDAGQVILRAGENGTVVHTLLEEHPDGTSRYIQGVIGDVIEGEKEANSEKGETAVFRPITLWTKVASS